MRSTNGSPLDNLPLSMRDLAEVKGPRTWLETCIGALLGYAVVAADFLRLLPEGFWVGDPDPTELHREPPLEPDPGFPLIQYCKIWSAHVMSPGEEEPHPLYCLVQVRSAVEWYMAIDLLGYISAQYMKLMLKFDIPLPMVVPAVLYVGEPPWDAPLEAAELFEVLEGWSPPQLEYGMVDLCRLEVPEGTGNLVELLASVVQGASEAKLLRGARALRDRLLELGDKNLESSFYAVMLALCDEKWPEEHWGNCANMDEIVEALEERTIAWPEKWKAQAIEEGRAEGRAEATHAMLSSLERAVRERFGESAAKAFGERVEVVRKGDAAQDLEVLDAICRCVMLSETSERLLAEVQAACPGSA